MQADAPPKSLSLVEGGPYSFFELFAAEGLARLESAAAPSG